MKKKTNKKNVKKKNEKIGLFGGTFNPLHIGHVNSMRTVAKKLKLKKVFVIPANQSPLKPWCEGPSVEQRVGMVKAALSEDPKLLFCDDQEILRGGKSYTIETLQLYLKKYRPEDLHLIIGVDAFGAFDQWFRPEEIIAKTNLVVTSRPGSDLPLELTDLPKIIRGQVQTLKKNSILLTTGRTIHFVQLEDVAVSSTDLRRRLLSGEDVGDYLPASVQAFIKENGLYSAASRRAMDYERLARFCASVMFSKKGIDVRGFDLRQQGDSVTEFTLISSGTSTRHTNALADSVWQAVKKEYGLLPTSIEGTSEGRWVLLDYGSLIIHIFYDYTRAQYRLEELWKKGMDMGLKEMMPEMTDENRPPLHR